MVCPSWELLYVTGTDRTVHSPLMAETWEKRGEERGDGPRPVWKDHNLHVIWGVTLMAVLGSSSISPAFPRIVAELGVSPGRSGCLLRCLPCPGSS